VLVLLGHSFPDSAYGYINMYTEFAREYIYGFHIKDELIKRAKRLLERVQVGHCGIFGICL
jgi:hypothetical protein